MSVFEIWLVIVGMIVVMIVICLLFLIVGNCMILFVCI